MTMRADAGADAALDWDNSVIVIVAERVGACHIRFKRRWEMAKTKKAGKTKARKIPSATKKRPAKPSAPKRASKKEAKKYSRTPATRKSTLATPVLGIVSSTAFTGTALAQAFCNALRAAGWEYDPTMPPGPKGRVVLDPREALGAYGGTHQELNNAVKSLNATADVIVTVGGSISAKAAADFAKDKPFLAIVGTTPNFNIDPHGTFRGGINLDTPGNDAARNGYVIARWTTIPANRVCLLHNKNAQMDQDELRAWRSEGWPDQAAASGDNSAINFANAFSSAAQIADAVVVSADPYFTQKRNDLVKAANNTNLRVCYPFEFYGTATPSPTTGSSMWFGPDLNDAYGKMGTKAASVLGSPNGSTGLDTANSAGPGYW